MRLRTQQPSRLNCFDSGTVFRLVEVQVHLLGRWFVQETSEPPGQFSGLLSLEQFRQDCKLQRWRAERVSVIVPKDNQTPAAGYRAE